MSITVPSRWRSHSGSLSRQIRLSHDQLAVFIQHPHLCILDRLSQTHRLTTGHADRQLPATASEGEAQHSSDLDIVALPVIIAIVAEGCTNCELGANDEANRYCFRVVDVDGGGL